LLGLGKDWWVKIKAKVREGGTARRRTSLSQQIRGASLLVDAM
jgi:hypothetical protein